MWNSRWNANRVEQCSTSWRCNTNSFSTPLGTSNRLAYTRASKDSVPSSGTDAFWSLRRQCEAELDVLYNKISSENAFLVRCECKEFTVDFYCNPFDVGFFCDRLIGLIAGLLRPADAASSAGQSVRQTANRRSLRPTENAAYCSTDFPPMRIATIYDDHRMMRNIPVDDTNNTG